MPSEDVERLRGSFERWNAGEREFADIVHPEVELHTPLSSIRGEPYRGLEGFRQWIADIDEQFDSWTVRLEDFRELRDGRVLALGAIDFRGRESGIEMSQPVGWLFELRDGRVIRFTVWTSHEEALAAVGAG